MLAHPALPKENRSKPEVAPAQAIPAPLHPHHPGYLPHQAASAAARTQAAPAAQLHHPAHPNQADHQAAPPILELPNHGYLNHVQLNPEFHNPERVNHVHQAALAPGNPQTHILEADLPGLHSRLAQPLHQHVQAPLYAPNLESAPKQTARNRVVLAEFNEATPRLDPSQLRLAQTNNAVAPTTAIDAHLHRHLYATMPNTLSQT